MDKRTFPLWLLFASGCSVDPSSSAPPEPGVFDSRDYEAEQLAEDLTDSFLSDKDGSALAGVDDVSFQQVVVDSLGMAHVRLQQTQGGIPVFGGQAIVHLLPTGEVTSMTDGFVRKTTVDIQPSLTSDAAIGRAIVRHLGGVSNYDADLQVLRHGDADHLTWRVQLEDLDTDTPSMPVVFIDAHTGEVVWEYDNLQTARNRNTYTANNGNSLPGSLLRTEGSGNSGNTAVDNAHNFAGTTYDYYSTQQGRDSYNGTGGTLTSTAHYSQNYDNAYWSGSQMVYGDGGTYFLPLSGSLEVVGHELTHAVTEYSAGLVYAGESGGLNEATSDIMGVTIDSYSRGWVVDANTWKVGESIAKPALGAALRFMDNPTLDGVSIANYAQYNSGVDVHYSSGIANKAFYLMVQDPALDIQQAANIWYRALTVYMTPNTTFAGARTATTSAATDLFGSGSAAVTAVGAAWTAVGVVTYTPFDTRTNLSGATNADARFTFNTPNGASAVQFATSGGTGDADLYVKFGSAPTTTSYDCRPYLNGNGEACAFSPAQSGTYHVLIHAYSAYSGVTLTASSVGGSPAPTEVCTDGIDNDGDTLTDCADPNCSSAPNCAPPPPTCPGGQFVGTLNSGNIGDEFQDAASRTGLFSATLTGPNGTDFDLYLEYWSGSRWRTRSQSISATSVENINFNEGSNVLHRWNVKRYSGDGAYTLCVH